MEIGGIDYCLAAIFVIGFSYFLNLNSRLFFLLGSSLLFYASFSFSLVLALILSGVINFFGAKWLYDHERKKLILTALVLFNIGLLVLFKTSILSNGFLVPVGISFFTFQALSYVIEVKNGKYPERKILPFLTYLSFFPQLIAGPIERYQDLTPQLKRKPIFKVDNVISGTHRLLIGLVKKFVIADRLAILVDVVFDHEIPNNGLLVLIGVLSFSFQIYMDFSAYSDMAIGIARWLGIELSENFKMPYLSASLNSFWRNWHFTLHRWFKLVVFQPLKRYGLSAFWSVLIVFILSALWHGIAWHYLIWGAACFVLLSLERALNTRISLPKWLGVIKVFVLITILWIPFRVHQVEDVFSILEALMNVSIIDAKLFCADVYFQIINYSDAKYGLIQIGDYKLAMSYIDFLIVLFFIGVLMMVEVGQKLKLISSRPLIGSFLCALVLMFFGISHYQPFIYLQF